MKYDFDKTIDRRATNSYKWDSAPEGVLPMWVADMDFHQRLPSSTRCRNAWRTESLATPVCPSPTTMP